MQSLRRLFACFFLLHGYLAGSSQDIFQLHEPGDQGILLNKGWKYKMADDPSFASPTFNDREWETIDPSLDFVKSPSRGIQSGIGWLRLNMRVAHEVREQTLALLVQQSGASEIFLNGKRVALYGKISTSPKEIRTYDPQLKPLAITLSPDSIQVLAVRFQLKPGVHYSTAFETSNTILTLKAYAYNIGSGLYRSLLSRVHSFEFLIIGLCLMLLIIHTSFFILYPQQKANLYFALYAFSYLIGGAIQTYYFLNAPVSEIKFITGFLTQFLFMLGDLFILMTIMTFLDQRNNTLIKILIVFFLLAIIFSILIYDSGWRAGIGSYMIVTKCIILFIAFRATRKNKRGAKILVWGALATVVFFFTFLQQGTFYQNKFVESLSLFRMINYLFYVLSIPIAVSVYLASDFAFTSRVLQQKLMEVKELSEKNLLAEKEKQDILSSQNIKLEKQVEERTSQLSRSLQELRDTQAQLIQSEKMASLGELTAGIAHEIQNPLNFVNNFTEVCEELISELETEPATSNPQQATAIQKEIKQNLARILQHGQRADSIVKGMLQHSRSGPIQKEPTDINALADEYLRLSYHGFRARDHLFNSALETNFDPSVGKINIVPQDISRVLLNLFNNAFYSVAEKQKLNGSDYSPAVSVSTTKDGNLVEIKVKDNGIGIPDKIKDKIFQPFFTTKPTGQGTGLGLSISYDILKAHGGDLNLESESGIGSLFIINLPMNNSTDSLNPPNA